MAPTAPHQLRVPMDPRIRRRRIEVQRIQGRRRLRLLVALLLVLALTAGAWVVARSPLVDVDRVLVEGAVRTPPAAVVHATLIRTRTAMIEVDEGGAARRVEALPWVAAASVRRRWPGTVVVTVTERTPVAVTGADGGQWALLDVGGRVLDTSSAAPPGLTVLEGLPPATQVGTTLDGADGVLAVVRALSPQLTARTTAVVAAPGGQVELRLNPRGTVRLGPPDDLETKVQAVERVLAQVDTRNLAILDVRLPSSPVLTRG